jgi:hypothetical protein
MNESIKREPKIRGIYECHKLSRAGHREQISEFFFFIRENKAVHTMKTCIVCLIRFKICDEVVRADNSNSFVAYMSSPEESRTFFTTHVKSPEESLPHRSSRPH